MEAKGVPASSINFLTGVGGVLYPPHCFHRDVLREDLFMSLCPHADDIWFWAMLVLQDKKIATLATEKRELRYACGSQEVGLIYINRLYGANDWQLAAVMRHYPEILPRLQGLPVRRLSLSRRWRSALNKRKQGKLRLLWRKLWGR